MNPDVEYLRHILERIARVREVSLARSRFEREWMWLDVMLYNLVIIGEAARRLSETTRALAPTIPWRDIIGLRNVLVHDYASVRIDEVLNVVITNVPQLQADVVRLLAVLDDLEE